MAIRKPTMTRAPARPELERLLEMARHQVVTEEELMEQRISFAYGNAPQNSSATKESVRAATRSIRLVHAS